LEKRIVHIALTGGPVGGKSSGAPMIREHLMTHDWRTVIVPETVTMFINAGIMPWDSPVFQPQVLRTQLDHEAAFLRLAQTLIGNDKILMLYDRGICDNIAYTGEEDFEKNARSLGTSTIALRNHYDAVIHLTSPAVDAIEVFLKHRGNNSARWEGKDDDAKAVRDTAQLDAKTAAAWVGHDHLITIDNSTDFEGKMRRVVNAVANIIGEPEIYEIERKFLIEMPDLTALLRLPGCHREEITQTYLLSSPGDEERVRKRGRGYDFVYTRTLKRDVPDSTRKRIQHEKSISAPEYLEALASANPKLMTIKKDRYCFLHNNQHFEVDIYPFWDTHAILELELHDERQTIDFPPQLQVVFEVTDDPRFKTRALAQSIPNLIPC